MSVLFEDIRVFRVCVPGAPGHISTSAAPVSSFVVTSKSVYACGFYDAVGAYILPTKGRVGERKLIISLFVAAS
jgi:hypothetical protein